jgi:hypothetical protein
MAFPEARKVLVYTGTRRRQTVAPASAAPATCGEIIPNVHRLKRHDEIYYAVKKILGKIKRHSLRSGIRPDNRPAHLPRIPLQFFLCPTGRTHGS